MRRLLSRELLILVTLVSVLTLVSGCGSKNKSSGGSGGSGASSTQPSSTLAQPKIVLYGALVYGAFHEYIAKAQSSGTLVVGAVGGHKARSQSAATALFMAGELRQMKAATLADDKLKPIADRIDKLVPRLGLLVNRLRSGKNVSSDVGTTSAALDGIVSAAKDAGAKIPLDKVPAVPGT